MIVVFNDWFILWFGILCWLLNCFDYLDGWTLVWWLFCEGFWMGAVVLYFALVWELWCCIWFCWLIWLFVLLVGVALVNLIVLFIVMCEVFCFVVLWCCEFGWFDCLLFWCLLLCLPCLYCCYLNCLWLLAYVYFYYWWVGALGGWLCFALWFTCVWLLYLVFIVLLRYWLFYCAVTANRFDYYFSCGRCLVDYCCFAIVFSFVCLRLGLFS